MFKCPYLEKGDICTIFGYKTICPWQSEDKKLCGALELKKRQKKIFIHKLKDKKAYCNSKEDIECGEWTIFTKYIKHTNNWDIVTCKKCLKKRR